jgi:hypothetical protein
MGIKNIRLILLEEKMNPKFGISAKVMKGIEWALILVFGFLVIREMNPVWLLNTEIFMPVVLPVSTALYVIYTVLITIGMVFVTIILLVFGIGSNSEALIKAMLKDMTIEKIEKLKIKQSRWLHVRSTIEDILIVYFSWALGKHYLAILAVIITIESRWLYGVWNQLADKLKVRFYDDLQKEVAKKEKEEFERDHQNDLL